MSQFATSRFEVNSSDLSNVLAVQGTATLLEEVPIGPEGAAAPSLYQRRYSLKEISIVRSDAETAVPEDLSFSGFTLLAPTQRTIDIRSPSLTLGGQAFFDSALPDKDLDVLLLIGQPPLDSISGFMGNSASVESGPLKGQPIRAFLVGGADATLPEAMLSFVGWQADVGPEAYQRAIGAPHPLIPLDALRIASRSGNGAQVALLAEELMHPAQPSGIKSMAVGLLADAIGQLPVGSDEVNKLLSVAVAGWEAERTYQVDAAYLRALQSVSGHIKESDQLDPIRGITDDYQIRELTTLSEQLKKSIR